MLTAAQILKTKPKRLFPGNAAAVKKAFRELASAWHPDHNKEKEAADVLAYLVKARDQALGLTLDQSIVLERRNGSKFRMDYIRATTTDGMTIYTGASSIAYFVPDSMSDLVRRSGQPKWKFANKDMEKEMTRFLPPYVRTEDLKNGQLMIYRRAPSQILMSDLMALHDGRIPPVHISWMVTRMNNIACYFEWAKQVLFGLLPEFLLVDLDSHGVALCGPPIFLTNFGDRPMAVPSRVLDAIPYLRDKGSVAVGSMDRILIRETACALLGDHGGVKLKADPEVRPDIAAWVISPPEKSAVSDYEKWESALGPRKFIKFGTNAQDYYG